MSNFRDLLNNAKADIREVDTAEAEQLREQGAVLLDVREADEFEQGAVPGSVFIPRGHLESQVEGRLNDKSAPVIVMCAGGVRSAFAARTLGELGYTDVVSMAGGFNKWKDEGRDWKRPEVLTPDQRNRYSRHLLLPEVGEEGQQKLLGARVLLLGAGGLGSPAALYLAAAGVGTIGIVDMDVVDESNLQRQILHNTDRIGERKVDSAKKTLTLLNPDIDVITHDVRLDASNMERIISDYDIVVDGADNFPVRYMLNDASVKLGIPVPMRASSAPPGRSCRTPGRYLHDHGMVRMGDQGLLSLRMGTGGQVVQGWMLPMQNQLFVIASDLTSGALVFGIFHGVPAAKAQVVDGLILGAALDPGRTPTASVMMFERIGDLSGDPAADDARFEALAASNPVAAEDDFPRRSWPT